MDLEKFQSLLEKAKMRYLDIQFINEYDVFWNSPSLFGDGDHLNAKGSKEFTRIIQKTVSAQAPGNQ